MKRNEAEEVFALLCAMYDLHPERSADLSKIWIPSLERRDATATMDVVGRWLDGRGQPERMPAIGVFVAIVKADEQKLRVPAEPCEVCIDGWVQIGVHVYRQEGRLYQGADIVAPCPQCDVGKLIEHPLEADGVWGEEGFWRGQRWTMKSAGVVELVAA